jgi:hypothetical protein
MGRLEGLCKLKEFNDLIYNHAVTRDLAARIVVPQTTALPNNNNNNNNNSSVKLCDR